MILSKKTEYNGKELSKLWEDSRLERLNATYAEEIYNGEIEKYLRKYLKQILEVCNKDLNSTPLMYDVNVCKSVIDKNAILYKNKLEREFVNASDEQEALLLSVYDDLKINNLALKINRLVKLLGSVLVIYDGDEVELYTKKDYLKINDGLFLFKNLKVGENLFTVTGDIGAEINYINSKKQIIKTDIFVSYFEVSTFENSIDLGLPSYTVSINASLTDVKNTVHHQAFAQPYIKTNAENVPTERISVGKSEVVHLKTSADGSAEEFGFISPNANISGAIDYIKIEASLFAQSRGLSMNDIIGSESRKSFTSALDRLLSMTDDYKNAIEDMGFMYDFEKKMFNAIKYFNNISDDVELSVTYYEPEMIKSLDEKIKENLELEKIGAQTRQQTIAKIKDIPIEQVEVLDVGQVENETINQ